MTLPDLGHRVLLFGCGGGYDVYNGFFLYRELCRRGHKVHLANYSFADDLFRYADTVIVRVTGEEPRTKKNAAYFPEADLARFLRHPVYAVRLFGPDRVWPEMQALCDELQIDSLVLVDGGHDAMILGEETEWGSPLEDTSSLIVAFRLTVPSKFVVCVSAPTEGMDWPLFLKNVAPLCTQWRPTCTDDVGAFESLLDRLKPQSRSIPNECILACLKGVRDEHHENPRLKERLFDNPRDDWPPVLEETATHYFISLDELVSKSQFYSWILEQPCHSLKDVNRLIDAYRNPRNDT